MELKDSITYQNLRKALDGELKASSQYGIYARTASREGYQQISNIFNETSRFERGHAEMWIRILNNETMPTTLENLQEASNEEMYAWTVLYKEYANTALQEGFPEIANLFDGVANIERDHDALFRTLTQNMLTDQVFCKRTEVVWICLQCGNLMFGTCAPEICPVCSYPQGYYALYCVDY